MRWRLALWYGSLTGLVLLLSGVMTYAAHTRSHYDDLDRLLASTIEHVAGETTAASTSSQLAAVLAAPVSDDVVIRAYGVDGQLVVANHSTSAPPIDPRTILTTTRPPYDPIAGLAPPLIRVQAGKGHFGLATGADGSRWRVYVLSIDGPAHYLTGASSLSRIDASIERFRALVALSTALGAALTLIAGWLLAERALRPVSQLTETASAIAHSRRLGERVPVGDRHDEMGQMAETFNEMLDSIEQSHRLQQRFIADASHELRAPLTAIQANLELLERQEAMTPDEQHESAVEASREARRLGSLVADLLALARADAGIPLVKERVELDRVLLDAFSEARRLSSGQRLEVAELQPVLVDGQPDRLKQLFLILLDNATKYTPADGRITLSVRRTGDAAEVAVQDTGIGIPPEDLPHVFERFYRADPARGRDPGGTGLGLAIAYWIVEQHDGSVSLASQVGRGTTATVTLPARR